MITQRELHHGVDYIPYEGMRVRNWPRYTISRGKVDGGGVIGAIGDRVGCF